MIFELLAIVAAQLPERSPLSDLEPADVAESVELFREICFKNFGNLNAIKSTMAGMENDFSELPPPKRTRGPIADRWHSKKAIVTYHDNLGEIFPQCAVHSVSSEIAHDKVVKSIALALGLGAVANEERNEFLARSSWDIRKFKGKSWSIHVVSRKKLDGVQLSFLMHGASEKKAKKR